MRKAILTVATAAMLAVPAAALHAQQAGADQSQADSWIHIRVDEEDGAKVRVNLPASLAAIAGDMAGKQIAEEGDLEFGAEGEVSLDDIRRMWRELQDAGDADFVEVQEENERVRVYRRGDRVHIDVDEDGEQKVRVRMPAALVDAILGTEGDELNVTAAMEKLARSSHGELVQVQDGKTSVRIWIDDESTQGS